MQNQKPSQNFLTTQKTPNTQSKTKQNKTAKQKTNYQTKQNKKTLYKTQIKPPELLGNRTIQINRKYYPLKKKKKKQPPKISERSLFSFLFILVAILT